MLYTISLKDNRLEKTDEIFFFDMSNRSELMSKGILSFTYDDDTNEYKYFNASGEEFTPELNEWLITVRDTIMSTYHSLFDLDALKRLKSRKVFNIYSNSVYSSYSNLNSQFMSSLGIMFFSDRKTIEHLFNLLNYYIADTVEVNAASGELVKLSKKDLATVIREAYINNEYIFRQENKAISDIASFTTEQEVNDYLPSIVSFNFFMEDKFKQGDISDIEAYIDNILSRDDKLKNIINISTEITQNAVIDLADEFYSLEERVNQLETKLKE